MIKATEYSLLPVRRDGQQATASAIPTSAIAAGGSGGGSIAYSGGTNINITGTLISVCGTVANSACLGGKLPSALCVCCAQTATFAGGTTTATFAGEAHCLTGYPEGTAGNAYALCGCTPACFLPVGGTAVCATTAGSANNSTCLGGKLPAALCVCCAQTATFAGGTTTATFAGSADCADYATTAGIADNAYNANCLGGVPAASYAPISNPTFIGNVTINGNQNTLSRTTINNTNTGTNSRQDIAITAGSKAIYFGVDCGNAMGTPAYLDNRSAGDFGYYYNGSRQFTVSTAGYVGIGVTPEYKFHIKGEGTGYWNGYTDWNGDISNSVLTIENSKAGGYDPVLYFKQTDSGGNSQRGGAIGMVGASSWTAGNNASMISDMYFAVRNNAGGITERLRISSNGNVGIGTSTPYKPLHIVSNNGSYGILRLTNDSATGAETTINYSNALTDTAYSWTVGLGPDGIGSNFGWYWNGNKMVLTTTGNLNVTGCVTAADHLLSSDCRIKQNIRDYQPVQLNTKYKTYELQSHPEQPRYGVIAQDLQKIAPELVRTDENGMLSVSYNDLFSREIAYLKCEIRQLKNDLNYYKNSQY